MSANEHGAVGTVGGRLGRVLAIVSAILTIVLTALNAYWSHSISEFEAGLKQREAALKEQQLQLEGRRDRLARYQFVHKLFDGVIKQNVAEKTLTVNLIFLALDKDEATKLFAGLQASQDPQARDIGRLGASLSIQGVRVLWVDDHPDNNAYERSRLEQLGAHFTLATSTREALPLLHNQTFQLVITDFARADDNNAGYTLLEEVNKLKNRPPLIIYGASANPEFIAEAKRRGAFGETNDREALFELALDAIRVELGTDHGIPGSGR